AYLARTAGAKLALVGRSGLRAEQGDRVEQVRALGGEVLVLRADVADAAQMRGVLAEIDARFGALHGVIYAAGNLDPSLFVPLDQMDRARCESHFHAKVHGLSVLEAVLETRPLDFCVLCSSIASVLGGLGYFAYTAANSFIDAFTHRHNQTSPVRWTSVNWD